MGQCLSAPEAKPPARPAAAHILASTSPLPGGAGRAPPAAPPGPCCSPLDEAREPLISLVLPQLGLSDLRQLSLASSALRELVGARAAGWPSPRRPDRPAREPVPGAQVAAAPDLVWHQAALNSLPPRHPVCLAQGGYQAAAVEHGRLNVALRSGKKPSLRSAAGRAHRRELGRRALRGSGTAPRRHVPGTKAVASSVSPDDAVLAIISRDGLLRFWDLHSTTLLRITEAAVLQATGVGPRRASLSTAVPRLPQPCHAPAGVPHLGAQLHAPAAGRDRQQPLRDGAHGQQGGRHAPGVWGSPAGAAPAPKVPDLGGGCSWDRWGGPSSTCPSLETPSTWPR